MHALHAKSQQQSFSPALLNFGNDGTGWSKEDWQKIEVLLKCGTGKDASTKQELQVNTAPD